MDEEPKRLWFRFHLSTAILLALGAGSLIAVQTKKFEVTCYGYSYISIWIRH